MNVYIEEILFPNQMKDAECNGVRNFSPKQASKKIEKRYIYRFFDITNFPLVSSAYTMTKNFKK